VPTPDWSPQKRRAFLVSAESRYFVIGASGMPSVTLSVATSITSIPSSSPGQPVAVFDGREMPCPGDGGMFRSN
jgi:hypothetical protein